MSDQKFRFMVKPPEYDENNHMIELYRVVDMDSDKENNTVNDFILQSSACNQARLKNVEHLQSASTEFENDEQREASIKLIQDVVDTELILRN